MSIFFLFLLTTSILSKEPQTISLSFDPEKGFYTVPMVFGSNGEAFDVQVDTTTSETWLPSFKTTLNVKKYNVSESSTGQKTDKTFEIEDEDGDVRGKACYDSVKIGDISLDHFGFVQVDEFEVDFKDYPQGKLGLGYKQEHGVDFDFLGKLKKNGIIDKKIFSINAETKELIIGEMPSHYKNQLYTTCSLSETNDLDDEYRQAWACELTHLFFNLDSKQKDKDLDKAFEVNARVTFDSAFPYISIPKRHLNAFKKHFMDTHFLGAYTEVKGKESVYFLINDESLVNSASISFVMEGYAYVIPSDKLFVLRDDGKYEMLVRFYKENDNIFSFGSPFLDFFTLVYDYDEEEVGFFGGERVEMTKEWYDYMNDMTPEKQKKQKQKNYIYLGIGFFLLVVIIALVYRNAYENKQNIRMAANQ